MRFGVHKAIHDVGLYPSIMNLGSQTEQYLVQARGSLRNFGSHSGFSPKTGRRRTGTQ